MARSPGHREHPEHRVHEEQVGERLCVRADGEVIADSASVIRVDEDGYPARYYFPRSDVKMDKLERTAKTTRCPFKGTAHYYSIDGMSDAAWTYEEPYEEHQTLKDRIAFYDDTFESIEIASG